MSVIKVVGIDASLNNFGVVKAGVDLDTGKITPYEVKLIQPPKADAETKKKVRKNSDDLRRARWLCANLKQVCKEADIAIAEMPFGSQSARAMASYGICLGVLASCPIPLIEVTPMEVKLAGAGHKTATKAEMIEWAVSLHPGVKWLTCKRGGKSVVTANNEHIADALAAIYAGVDTEQFQMAAAMFRRMVSNG